MSLSQARPCYVALHGSFYGINTLPNNGSSTAWVHCLSPQERFTKLAELPLFAMLPAPPLVLAPNGTLYGAVYGGGANQAGQIYKIPPGGPLTILATFPGGNGMQTPASLFMANDGNLYGTTHTPSSLSSFACYCLRCRISAC